MVSDSKLQNEGHNPLEAFGKFHFSGFLLEPTMFTMLLSSRYTWEKYIGAS